MAGSWGHIVDENNGKFIGVRFLDNLGDAAEALEECYGMIYFLANTLALNWPEIPLEQVIEAAARQYKDGIIHSPGIVNEKLD